MSEFDQAIIALLRMVLEDESKPDFHWHVCPIKTCLNVWSHDRAEIPKGENDYDAAHTCPKCKVGKQRHKCRSEDEAEHEVAKYRARVMK